MARPTPRRANVPSARGARIAESASAYLEWLMDRDRKSPALKRLQGLIWEGGYRSGELQGEVFRRRRAGVRALARGAG